MYTAPKSLQKTPVWIIMRTLLTGSLLVMEHLELRPLRPSTAAVLGTQLAQLHLNNQEKIKKSVSNSLVGQNHGEEPVGKFGFDVTTCCGYLPLQNDWSDDWVRFYCR